MTIASGNHFALQRCTPMTRAEEYECAIEYVKTKNPILAERLIVANMRLVVTIARGFCRAGGDMRDLVQEGNRGLIHAVERYDPHRDVKLCSYAAWWIRAYILKFTLDNWRLVKAGTTQTQRKLFFSLRKERNKLERMGIEATPKQLASTLRVKESDVVSMLERFAGGETSLDAPLSSRGPETRTIGDSLRAASALRPDLRVEAAEFSRILRQKLEVFGDTLEGRESDVFWQRLLSEEPVTLAHLAADFGVTRERTRQVEKRLKGRIRDYLKQELGDALGPEGMAA
jgi:RNA polymerase sigma-32 factor